MWGTWRLGFAKQQPVTSHAQNESMIPVHVGTTVDEAERLLIQRTLEATGQNKTRAAEILGVSLKTLHNKLKEYSRTRAQKQLPTESCVLRPNSSWPSRPWSS